MIVTIHQPSYLPWIPFVEKGLQSDIFVLLDDVQFEKNSEQNRNRIKTSQGATWLSVPVTRNADTLISEVQIAAQPPGWHRKHRRSILAGSGWLTVAQMLERRAATVEPGDQASSHNP